MKPTPHRRPHTRLHEAAGEALRVRVVEAPGDAPNAGDARVALRMLARLLVRAQAAQGDPPANADDPGNDALTVAPPSRPHVLDEAS